MSREPNRITQAEFSAQAEAIARRIALALPGEQNPFLVLEALYRLHRFTCKQLPPDTLSSISFGLAAYAGELMQASATGRGLDSSIPVH